MVEILFKKKSYTYIVFLIIIILYVFFFLSRISQNYHMD